MAANQCDAASILDVNRFRRADAISEGEEIANLARTTALRIRGGGNVVRAIGLQQMFEPRSAKPVTEERYRLGTVLFANPF